MAEIKLDNSSSDHADAAEGITRRELLKTGGKVAAAAAVSSVFSPFFIHSARAATKTLSFWQFYAPNGISNLQSKWFVDCVAAWNATHDVKVELQYVPNNDYMNGTKLQTAFASGHGPDIFIISPGDFLRYYNGGVLTDLTPYMEEEAKKEEEEIEVIEKFLPGKHPRPPPSSRCSANSPFGSGASNRLLTSVQYRSSIRSPATGRDGRRRQSPTIARPVILRCRYPRWSGAQRPPLFARTRSSADRNLNSGCDPPRYRK